MLWAPERQPYASQVTPKLQGAALEQRSRALHVLNTVLTQGKHHWDLLLWHLLNFSISCC